MGERVNIQYSVDIDNLGDEVCRLIGDAYENLNRVNDTAVVPASNVMSLQTIKEIDDMRHDLSKINDRLTDALNIINGYIGYQSDLITQQSLASHADQQMGQAEEEEAEEPSALEAVTNLQEQIKQFQNQNEIAP